MTSDPPDRDKEASPDPAAQGEAPSTSAAEPPPEDRDPDDDAWASGPTDPLPRVADHPRAGQRSGRSVQSRTPIRWRRWGKRALWMLAIVACTAGPLAYRVSFEARAELEAADHAQQSGDVEREIVHLGRALRWRLPLSGHDEVAIDRLLEIGGAHAQTTEGASAALSAYREVRRGLLATRAWGVPHEDVFHLVNGRIAELMAAQERRFGTNASGDEDPYAYHLRLLEQVPGPDPLLGNLAAFSFIAWLGACAGFVFRCLDARGRLRPKRAVRWGGAVLVLLVAWVVLLRFS
jgi:hypothetical protein